LWAATAEVELFIDLPEVGEEAIEARSLASSAKVSAGRGYRTHVPIVGWRVVVGDGSTTGRVELGESRGLRRRGARSIEELE
jgi:hypothetical protein